MNQCTTSSTNETSTLTTMPTTALPNTDTVSTGTNQKTNLCTCTTVGGALGALSGVLVLALAAVVLGWSVSCHRTKTKHNRTVNLLTNADIKYVSSVCCKYKGL